MALLRLIYDSVVFLTFYISGVCMYYQHKSYDYGTHPLTVITCKIGAIIQILLSMNLFFSSYTNNFIYIVDVKDVGSKRCIEENDRIDYNEQENDPASDAVENQENTPMDDAENEGKDVAKEIPPLSGAKNEVEINEEKQSAAADAESKAEDRKQETAVHGVEEIAPVRMAEK